MYNPLVTSICRRYSNQYFKDISQEVWMKIYEKWNYYKNNQEIEVPDIQMIKTISHSKSKDWLRKLKNNQSTDIIPEIEEDELDVISLDINLSQVKRKLIEGVNSIRDDTKRRIAIFVFLLDKPQEQILYELSLLGINIKKPTLVTYTWRIKDYLKKYIESKPKKAISFDLGDEEEI